MKLESLDITPEQLRSLVAAAEHGSFTAAAAAVGKSQSAVSQNIASLEAELGVPLFDRGRYRATLTPAGARAVELARNVLEEIDRLGRLARAVGGGMEPLLSLAVDEFFPVAPLLGALRALRARFPALRLDVRNGPLGEVADMVVRGVVQIGVSGPLEREPDGLTRKPLTTVGLLPVAAPSHPLAQARGTLGREVLRRHVQIALTDRSPYTEGAHRGMVGSESWLVGSLATKRGFLLEGMGWGTLPRHLVAEDLATGRLVRLDLEGWVKGDYPVRLDAIHLERSPPGAAGQWLIDRLAQPIRARKRS